MRPSALRLCTAVCTTLTLSGRNVTFWKGPISLQPLFKKASLSGSAKTFAKHAPASPQWWPSRTSWGLRAYRQPIGHLANPHPHRMRPLARVCPTWVCQPTIHPSSHPTIQPSNIPTIPVLETSCSCPKYTRDNMANFISISPQKIGQLQAFKGPFQV